jgi:hypothetical protein
MRARKNHAATVRILGLESLNRPSVATRIGVSNAETISHDSVNTPLVIHPRKRFAGAIDHGMEWL